MAYYWYQSDPQLYQMEVAAMKKFFPSFTINQLQDGSGRLYWRGKVQPTGEGGMVWDIMLIYKNTHPHVGSANEYGGTVQILPLSPRLKDVADKYCSMLSIHLSIALELSRVRSDAFPSNFFVAAT